MAAWQDPNLRLEAGADGVWLAVIDMPGRSMNVFSAAMMDSLERLLDHVDAHRAIEAVVLTSGKPSFLAGADLAMIREFTERARRDPPAALHNLCGRLGRLFRRLERCGRPFVAALNGLALGGGLEVALACQRRVAADARGVQLGLPEVKLGLLPGAGGTQRLPRLIGAQVGLNMLLSGEPVTPARALELGLVHAVVPPEQLLTAAREAAIQLADTRQPWDLPEARFDAGPFEFAAADAYRRIAAAAGLSAQQLAHYPAYTAIMECVVQGWRLPIEQATEHEMDIFVELIRNPVAGNMVRTLFLNRQRAARLGPGAGLAKARLAVGGEGTEAQTLRTALSAAKAPLVDAQQAGGGDVVLVAPGAAATAGIAVNWLLAPKEQLAGNGTANSVWISEAGEHGRAVEVLAASEAAADPGLALARWLRATPLLNTGTTVLLPRLAQAQAAATERRLEGEDLLLAVALAAARAVEEGATVDEELADVAAVIAGLHPAYTGGPFNYLRQAGAAEIRERAAAAGQADLFALPQRLDSFAESP